MLVKEKMQDIYNRLQTVVEGEIIVDQNDSFCLKNNKFKEPIILQNLSTGLKSFVILKLLLEKGGLKEKDVVILDEPEIHLHPQWQIAYAELIVLIQKAFDLSIIVTTHSPYFVDPVNMEQTAGLIIIYHRMIVLWYGWSVSVIISNQFMKKWLHPFRYLIH